MVHCMKNALRRAGLNPDDIGYINAHGTGTLIGDPAEMCAHKAALGEAALRVPVSSTKSTTGHMMGGPALWKP